MRSSSTEVCRTGNWPSCPGRRTGCSWRSPTCATASSSTSSPSNRSRRSRPFVGRRLSVRLVKRDDRWTGVHAAVSARVPADDRETAARARFLEDLERLPFPFSEDADPTHVTASAIVVGSRGTVLHVHRRTGMWLQPGGHIDPGESPTDAALRETVEETGLAV